MNFQDSFTKVQYSMDTSLLKNRREFAKRMYLEGMKRSRDLCEGQPDVLDCIFAIANEIGEESE